jgi:Organic solute transporter Ostalpha
MTFWQGFVIQVMASLGMVNDKAALQIQNLLICIEMLIASVAHFYIFPYHEWQEGYKREKQKSTLIRDTLALQDFVRDMQVMTTPWETAPDPSALNGTSEGHAVTMCYEEAEGGKATHNDGLAGDVVGDRPDGAAVHGQTETGRTATSDIDRCRSERSDRSEWSSGDSGQEDLEGGESYFSYTSILFNQLDSQVDSRPAATMMHSLYSDSPLHTTSSLRSKSTGSSLPLSLSVRPEHGYRALRGDERDRDRDRDFLAVPETRRGTSGGNSSSGSGGGGSDLAAALGSINRNMLELSELGILDLGSSGAAGMLCLVLVSCVAVGVCLCKCLHCLGATTLSVQCNVNLCCAVLYCAMLCCAVLCCAVLCLSIDITVDEPNLRTLLRYRVQGPRAGWTQGERRSKVCEAKSAPHTGCGPSP